MNRADANVRSRKRGASSRFSENAAPLMKISVNVRQLEDV